MSTWVRNECRKEEDSEAFQTQRDGKGNLLSANISAHTHLCSQHTSICDRLRSSTCEFKWYNRNERDLNVFESIQSHPPVATTAAPATQGAQFLLIRSKSIGTQGTENGVQAASLHLCTWVNYSPWFLSRFATAVYDRHAVTPLRRDLSLDICQLSKSSLVTPASEW